VWAASFSDPATSTAATVVAQWSKRTWDHVTGSGAREGLSVMLITENDGQFEGVILPTPE